MPSYSLFLCWLAISNSVSYEQVLLVGEAPCALSAFDGVLKPVYQSLQCWVQCWVQCGGLRRRYGHLVKRVASRESSAPVRGADRPAAPPHSMAFSCSRHRGHQNRDTRINIYTMYLYGSDNIQMVTYVLNVTLLLNQKQVFMYIFMSSQSKYILRTSGWKG